MSTENTLQEKKGIFVQSLVRNNKKIRDDRALDIVETAEMAYKREVENIGVAIRKLKRERDGLLDLSPTNADSLVLASDFDENAFVQKDIELGIKIRNLEIRLKVAEDRYNELFTGEVKETN